MEANLNQSITTIGYSLYPLAYKFCKDTETAADIVQDTILKALMNIEKYREGTNLKGWLYTIMRNIFINEYRRKKRYHFTDNSSEFDSYMANPNISVNDGMAILGHEEIQKELAKVEGKYTIPFMMHFIGHKYEEIAEELKLPIGTVKNRIHIARKELQEKVTRY
jgi:RNA polymerase sigma-70 factor (ECF subfamily)